MAYIFDDCMEMIGHDYIFIASDILKFIILFNTPFVVFDLKFSMLFGMGSDR